MRVAPVIPNVADVAIPTVADVVIPTVADVAIPTVADIVIPTVADVVIPSVAEGSYVYETREIQILYRLRQEADFSVRAPVPTLSARLACSK